MSDGSSHKVFIVGLGKRALVHAEIMSRREDSLIIGGFDPSQSAREACQRSFRFPVYDQLKEGLQQTLPTCILIATPPQVRIELFDFFPKDSSLRTIIVEKPLALTIKEAQALYQLCAINNWQLIVVHQSRYCEEFIRLKNSISEGRIGELQLLKSSHYGNIFNQGSHAVDLLRWIMNGERILWVDATGNDDKNKLAQLLPGEYNFESDEDHPGNLWSSINMRFKAGVEVFMTSGILDTRPIPALGPWMQRRILAVGTKGTAEAHLCSHFKERIIDEPSSTYITSPSHYLDSLKNFYDTIFKSLNAGHLSIQSPEDNLYTLGTLIAAYASANHHTLIPIPQDIKDLSALDSYLVRKIEKSNTTSTLLPLISVIIPMETHRGLAEDAVASWTQEQYCDSSLYEVIVVCHKHQTSMRNRLIKKLRPHDQLVFIDGLNEIHLSHHGATLAKGKYLLFTESHCIAEAYAVRQAIEFFKQETHAGFYPRTVNICKNLIAELEAKHYEMGFNQFNELNYWAKIVLHAFGINKEIYFLTGGFEFRYNRFSYWLLAAHLFKQGFTLGYAPDVGVKHHFSTSFSHLKTFLADCIIGECLYKAEVKNKDFCYSFFPSYEEWNQARSFHPKINYYILKIILKYFWSKKVLYFFLTSKEFNKHLFYFFYKRLAILLPRYCQKIKSRVYFYLSRTPDLKWKYFINYQENLAAWHRVRLAFVLNKTTKPLDCERNYLLSELNEENLYGLYAPENYKGHLFRWTKGIAAIKLNLQPQCYRVSVKILDIRCAKKEEVLFFIGAYAIKAIEFKQQIFTFLIPKNKLPKHPWLIIFANVWDVIHGDKRPLGLPIHSIHVEPIDFAAANKLSPMAVELTEA